MRELIYYPSFEVRHEDWLKFALLYMDELNPIIPPSGDNYLSELYQRLIYETDLLMRHRPDYEEGLSATMDAVQVTERILQRPTMYRYIFRTHDILDRWKNPINHEYTLFREKFSDEWERFCLDNGFASPDDVGLRMPTSLAYVYMTLLAQAIADARGIPPITDHANLDRFSILARTSPRRAAQDHYDRLELAQTVIDLRLPEDLSEIGFDEIIAFRNRSGFKERLRAFHDQLDRFYDDVEEEVDPEEFVNAFENVWWEFTEEILSLGAGVTSIGLTAWILTHSQQPPMLAEYLNEIVIGGGMALLNSVRGFNNNWEHTQTQRFTRKYLADLSRIETFPN